MPSGPGLDRCDNVDVVVDATHKLIVTHALTSDVTDQDQLAAMAIQAKERLEVAEVDAVADKGFSNGEQVKQCDQAAIRASVAKPDRSRNQHKGLFTKADFSYDSERDRYGCRQGQELSFRFETEQKGRATR